MDYSIELIDIKEETLSEITRFLQETFPKNNKFTSDFIRWQYAENPEGNMVGFNAWYNGKIVSHFASLPLTMNLFGDRKKGLLCINVSTNIEHRGKKLFTILGEKTIEYAKANDFDFMIAVPNANSTHAFLKYFDFYLISQLSAKVGFGENIYSNQAQKCFREWEDKVWEWRLKNPTNKYAYNPKGYVYSPISFFAKTISKTELPQSIASRTKKTLGLRPLNLYIGLGANTKAGLYYNIPSFIKRPPFNLVFKDLKGNLPIIGKEDIFLQIIDLDTI